MKKISDLITDLENKTEQYHKKYCPTGWIKSMDISDGNCLMFSEDKTVMHRYANSIYVCSLLNGMNEFWWGYSASNLPQEMRDKTRIIQEIGKKNRILEFIEPGLLIEPHTVQRNKIIRKENNEENAFVVGETLCSKYSMSELVGLASKVLNPDGYLMLDFPEYDYKCIYFLYGEPKVHVLD